MEISENPSDSELQKIKVSYLQDFEEEYKTIKRDHWKDYVVFYPLYFEEQLKYIRDRHYFFLTKVKSPIMENFRTFKTSLDQALDSEKQQPLSLEKFVGF